MRNFNNSHNKKDIIITDNEKVIAYAGNFKQDISNKRISMRLEEKMNKRQTQVVDKAENFEFLENSNIFNTITYHKY